MASRLAVMETVELTRIFSRGMERGAAPEAPSGPANGGRALLRAGASSDAPAIHALIARYQAPGRLLPRQESDLARHASRFLVVEDEAGLAACAELMPLGTDIAEIRSLVVDERLRRHGVGRALVQALIARATAVGLRRLCVFTHEPGYFARLGFSLVPHGWLPEKIAADCATCALFRRCGQAAMEQRLDGVAADRSRACA